MLAIFRHWLGRTPDALQHAGASVEIVPSPSAPSAPSAPLDYVRFAEYDREEREARLSELAPTGSDARELARVGAQRVANRLPPLPAMAQQAFAVLQNPHSRATDVAVVVNSHPAVAASVLKVATSGGYSGRKPVFTVSDAVARLGYGEVGRIAAGVAATPLFLRRLRSDLPAYEERFDTLWTHALATAFTAASVAIEHGFCDANEAFMAALFHDIGKTVALEGVVSELNLRTERGNPEPGPVEAHALAAVLEDLHTQIGHTALLGWKLPESVCEVLRNLHALSVPAGEYAAVTSVVRLVSGLNVIRTDPGHPVQAHTEVRVSASALRLDDRAITHIVATLRASAAKAADLRNNVH